MSEHHWPNPATEKVDCVAKKAGYVPVRHTSIHTFFNTTCSTDAYRPWVKATVTKNEQKNNANKQVDNFTTGSVVWLPSD